MGRTFYLCDGKVKKCSKKNRCYKNGGPCQHTRYKENAINPEEKENFMDDMNGNKWEIPKN